MTRRHAQPRDRRLAAVPTARLTTRDVSGGGVVVHRGRTLIAEARPGELDDAEPPPPPTPRDAVLARHAHPALLPAVWAALDCPSYPAAALRDGVIGLLGTTTARVDRRPPVGEQVVVSSWRREQVGRRHETSVAMVDAGGDLVARADATWIAARHQRLVGALGRFV